MSDLQIRVIDRTPELMQKVIAATGRFVRKGTHYTGGEIKSSMAEPKSGKRYGAHVASAQGESPAVETGNLTNSIVAIFPSTLEGKIGTPVEYAMYLEEGTENMAARPVWETERKEALPTLEKMLAGELHGLGSISGSLS